jgi:hypothetical protein
MYSLFAVKFYMALFKLTCTAGWIGLFGKSLVHIINKLLANISYHYSETGNTLFDWGEIIIKDLYITTLEIIGVERSMTPYIHDLIPQPQTYLPVHKFCMSYWLAKFILSAE